MTAVMAQRDQQADERMKFISETLHRRDIDVDKRMMDLMTTVQELTQGVKAVVATVPSRLSPVPMALNPANVSFTSACPPQQSTYTEVRQCQSETKPDQVKQPKLQPHASYKSMPAKAQVASASHTQLRRCEIRSPPSFNPYARGATTTGEYYSAASGLMTRDAMTSTGDTEYQTAVSSNPSTKHPALISRPDQLRPFASSTRKKPPRRGT